jgi:adhesin/invasin
LTVRGHLLSRLLLIAAAAGASGSCGGDDLTLPNEGEPAELAMLRGDGQNGTVGEPLADSLVVRVRDRFGTPVEGVEVSWTADGGGSVDPATAVTDASGRAGAQRTLGPQPGPYITVAAVAELPEAPVVFTTTGVAARLSLVTQPAPAAVSGVALERQPVLQLLDSEGEPVARSGIVVTVQIATGGGTLGGTTSVASDANGLVTFTDLSIRGIPGVRTLLFAADAFASAASAPIAVGVGAPTTIAPAEGIGQTATVNTAVAVAPAVLVTDGEGNPVSGIPVTFDVGSGGGSVTGGNATTGADGIARVGTWTLGRNAGANTLEATVEGLDLEGSPATFTATGLAGAFSPQRSCVAAAPDRIAASTGGGASVITVTARDEFGNPIQGLNVALAATGSGNALTQPAQPTNGSGQATGALASTAAGNHVVSATISGQAIPATATVAVTAAGPSAVNSSASAGNGTAGSRTTVTVDLKDAFNNPVTGAGGRISAQVTGANTATGEAAQEQGGGRYTVAYTPHAAGTDQIVVLVDGTPVAGGPLSSTVVPGPASPAATTAVVPSAVSVFNKLVVVVTVRDADGNVRTGGGDRVLVRASERNVEVEAAHTGNGTYVGIIDEFRLGIGSVAVDVLVNGTPIAGSPFTVNVVF